MTPIKIGLIDNMQSACKCADTGMGTPSADTIMAATGGNTGNLAFVHAIRKLLDGSVQRIHWGMDSKDVNDSIDHIVVCCANQLGEHIDLGSWADSLEQLDKPVTLLGLGAQSHDMAVLPDLPQGTLRFLKVVESRRAGSGPNIGVRGRFTQRLLSTQGIESTVIGCPSLHISDERKLGQKVLDRQHREGIRRVAVAAGNPWHTPSAFLEPILVDVVNGWHGEYVVQHPVSMLKYAFGEMAHVNDMTRDRFLEVYGPSFDEASLLSWYRRYAVAFSDIFEWMRFLGKFDLALGPRYHGVALGIQVGVPGCVVTIDTRTEELCLETGVKSLSIGQLQNINAQELVDACRWNEEDADRFDKCREGLAISLCNFLDRTALRPSRHLHSISTF